MVSGGLIFLLIPISGTWLLQSLPQHLKGRQPVLILMICNLLHQNEPRSEARTSIVHGRPSSLSPRCSVLTVTMAMQMRVAANLEKNVGTAMTLSNTCRPNLLTLVGNVTSLRRMADARTVGRAALPKVT